jgi:arginase
MGVNKRLLTPFLMGQRRSGLCRVCEVDHYPWEVNEAPQFVETHLTDANEKLRRMSIIYASLSEAVKDAVINHQVPISIAGDCVSSMGVLSGLQKAGVQPDRLIWLDAHGDFHTWDTTQTKYLGGMPLAMLVGRPDRRHADRDASRAFLQTVGLRPYPEQKIILSDARDLDDGEKQAVESSRLVKCDIGKILEHIVPGEKIYLHFDTDVVNAVREMPALKYVVDGGPTYDDMMALFKELGKQNLVAVSVSAWHEEEDRDNKTATACLRLLEMLGLEKHPA